MTQETVRQLSDADLQHVVTWAQDEIKTRAQRRKEETIIKIKALAESIGVKIAIDGARGRPARVNPDAKKTIPASPHS